MGAVALLLEGATCQPETCDLYLRHGFANAAAISRRLRDEHLTRAVVDVAPGKGASLDLRGSEASVAMDESARAQATGRHVPDAPYVRILCSYPFNTVKALLQASPDAELVLFDGGLGSHGGDILRDNGGSGPPRPAALYVSAPELCHSSASDVIRKLPFSLGDRRLADTLQRIFAVDYAQLAPYHGKRCVYLTQPVDAYAERAEMDRRVLELFDPHEREVIVRPHPRDNSPRDPRIAYDESGIPWKLAYKSGIVGEGPVLLAGCSTAQVMPRILLGIEPHIVCTAELYATVTEPEVMAVWHGPMDTIANSYAHRERIHRPRSLGELAETLDAML